MIKTIGQIQRLLEGFEYNSCFMGSTIAISPKPEEYNRIREILEKLPCKVSRLTLDRKKKNIIYVFTEQTKDIEEKA